jgi:hypothetical protein
MQTSAEPHLDATAAQVADTARLLSESAPELDVEGEPGVASGSALWLTQQLLALVEADRHIWENSFLRGLLLRCVCSLYRDLHRHGAGTAADASRQLTDGQAPGQLCYYDASTLGKLTEEAFSLLDVSSREQCGQFVQSMAFLSPVSLSGDLSGWPDQLAEVRPAALGVPLCNIGLAWLLFLQRPCLPALSAASYYQKRDARRTATSCHMPHAHAALPVRKWRP